MAQNNFIIDLIASLQKTRSKQQIKADIKALGDFYVKLIGNLDMAKTRKYIRNQLKGLSNNTFTITPTINSKGVQNATVQAIRNAQKIANSNKVYYSFDIDKKKLQNQLKIFAKENSRLFSSKEMTMKYNQLVDSANIAKSKAELKGLRRELSAFKVELLSCNKAGMNWIDKFKASISHFAQYFSGASFIYAVTNQLRNATTQAKSLDDSLVSLMKVTDEIANRDALYKYFDRAMNKANELNVKVDSLIYAITEFKKLGWSLSDAELGGKWVTMLENVGDVDIDTAIGSIKTAIASFDEIGGYTDTQMDKKLEAYVDLINNMSNKYSIDAEGLAEAIRLSAGTLTEANTSIEQAATMFATANKYYNDPSYLGNTAKIGSLRLRATTGDKEALEDLAEMGEDIEDVTILTGKLREELLSLTGVDIMVDNTTFKSYYDQLYEISQVINELDDTTSAKVLETLFGKNRAAAGMSLLSGLQESEKAYADAINSAGSATEEYATWMQGADAATQRFANSLTELYQSIINGNTVRDLANIGSAILDLANAWGIVEGAAKGYLALKIGSLITNGAMAFITATKQVEQYGRALQLANNIPNGNLSQRFSTLKSIAQATSTLTTAQLKQVLSNQALSQQDRIRILMMQNMTREMATQKLAEMNLTSATNAQTAANTASTASTFSLKSAMVGLGATMKSVFLSNPVGIVLMAISVGISAVTSAVSNHNQKLEEMRDKAKEAANEANTLGDEIAELANKYIALSEAVKTDADAKEDLITTQTELLKKLGLEGESIDDLIAKYGSLSEAIRQASIDSLKNSQIDLIAGVDAAREELLKVSKDNFWGSKNILNATGDDAVKAFKELAKAGVVSDGSYGSAGGSLILIGDDTVEGALQNFQILEEALKTLRDSNAFTQEELSNNSLFQTIYGRYSEMKDEIEAYKSSIENLNENLAQQTMLTALQGSEIPKTKEDFEKFRQELIDTAVASKQFIGSEEEIANAINKYLSTVPEFEGYYSVPLEKELDKVDALLSQDRFSKQSISSTIDQINTQLKPALESLKDAYQDVFTIDSDTGKKLFSLDNVGIDTFDSIKSSLDELNKIDGINVDYSSFENFVSVLSNSSSTAEEVQAQFDNLATSIIFTTDCTNMSAETYGLLVTSLQNLGITNAEEVLSELRDVQEELIDAGYNLADITVEEAAELLNLGKVSLETAEYLRLYLVQKELVQNPLNTSADIAALESLCNSLGITGKLYEYVIDLKRAFDSKERGAVSAGLDDSIENIKSKIAELSRGEGGYKFSFDGIDPSSKKSKSSKDTTKEFDWIENAISNIEKRIKSLQQVIDSSFSTTEAKTKALKDQIALINQEIELQQKAYETYMAKAESVGLSDKYKNLVQNGDFSIEDITDKDLQEAISKYSEYYEKAQDTLDKINELHDEARQKHVDGYELEADELKRILDNQGMTEKQYLDEMESLWKRYFENQVDMAEVAKDKKLALLNEEKSYMQTVANAALSLIDDQIDALESQKDSAVQGYKDQIKAIEAQKKALEEQLEQLENERKKREIILGIQQAQYNLENAKNQKDQYKYVNGQMIYTADDKKIKEAREELDDAKFELTKFNIQQQIDAYDKQIEKLNELIEETEKYYDDQIKGLQKYKDEWQKAIDMEELAISIKNFTDMFGEGSIARLLTGDMSLITEWKQSYLDTLAEIDMTSTGSIGDITKKFAELAGLDISNVSEQLKIIEDDLVALSSTTDAIDTASKSMDNLDTSASNARESTSQIASDMETLNTNSDGVSENITGISTALDSIPDSTKFDAVAISFEHLGEAIKGVADALGVGTEGTVGGLVTALQEISTLSLDNLSAEGGTGIISQFEKLKTAVEGVTSAIGGGMGNTGENGGTAQNANGGAEGTQGSSGSLISALGELKSTADATLGSGGDGENSGEGSDEEGEGVIGKFEQFKSAVDAVTMAIGTGEEEEGYNENGAFTLIGALQAQYDKASEVIPAEKSLFEELLGSIMACVDALVQMSSAIGSLPGIGGGNAYASGTRNAEKGLALVGEEKPEVIVTNDDKVLIAEKPSLVNMEGGETVYNGNETEKLLNSNGVKSLHKGQSINTTNAGNAYAKGTDDGTVVMKDGTVLRPLREGDEGYDLMKKAELYFEKFGNQIIPPVNEMNKNMEMMAKNISYVNNNSNMANYSVGDVHIHCPGVTKDEVVKQIGDEMTKTFFGLSNKALQRANITR